MVRAMFTMEHGQGLGLRKVENENMAGSQGCMNGKINLYGNIQNRGTEVSRPRLLQGEGYTK